MRGVVVVVFASCVVAGCPSPLPPPITRVPPRRDAGPPRDAGHFDTGPDAPDFDAGPGALLPPEAWMLDVTAHGDPFQLTVDLDVRGQSGRVRAVAGASGRSSALELDVVGHELHARGPIAMGLPGEHACSIDTVAIDDLVLAFVDLDHDGLGETLVAASGSMVTRSSATMHPAPMAEVVTMSSPRVDRTPPTLDLETALLVLPYEDIVLVASEPMEPSFLPRLVGPRTASLVPDGTASAAARWRLATTNLPPGHYTIDLGASPPHDLSGLAQTPAPAFAFDVPPLVPPAIDDLDAAVVAVLSATPMTVLGDDPGEVALVGATSLLAPGRVVVVFDSSAGARGFNMLARLEGPFLDTTAAQIRIVDGAGVLAGHGTYTVDLSRTSVTAGFAVESDVQIVEVAYTAATAGRFYAIIDPGGFPDPTCRIPLPTLAGVGITLDQIRLY